MKALTYFDDMFVTIKFHLFQQDLMNDEVQNIISFASPPRKLQQRTLVRFPGGRTF